MQFTFLVIVEVSREQGKFATRDELSEQIIEALESADPGSVEGSEGGEYNVDTWEVTEQEKPKPKRRGPSKVLQKLEHVRQGGSLLTDEEQKKLGNA